eukprot:8670379-Alexandrium_andersonii.AAC.1
MCIRDRRFPRHAGHIGPRSTGLARPELASSGRAVRVERGRGSRHPRGCELDRHLGRCSRARPPA